MSQLDNNIFQKDINTTQSKRIQLSDITDFTNKCVFNGKISSVTKVKHGYNAQTTLYGNLKIKHLSTYQKVQITITFIDYENKLILDSLFENTKRLLLTDETVNETSGIVIEGESLVFEEKFTINGEVFYTSSFEIRT